MRSLIFLAKKVGDYIPCKTRPVAASGAPSPSYAEGPNGTLLGAEKPASEKENGCLNTEGLHRHPEVAARALASLAPQDDGRARVARANPRRDGEMELVHARLGIVSQPLDFVLELQLAALQLLHLEVIGAGMGEFRLDLALDSLFFLLAFCQRLGGHGVR